MIYKVSDNIISSLGFSSKENFSAVLNEKTGLQHYENTFEIPEPFVASLIDTDKLEDAFWALHTQSDIKYTRFEKIAILSVYNALQNTAINPAEKNVLFIFSTTKGNIELLENNTTYSFDRIHLWRSTQLIAQYFGNTNEPVVVSNACISGVAAQITAARQLRAGRYKYVVVVGADVLSKFVISGFQSFKALSPDICKPFDKDRAGLNLGEAAATIIYSYAESGQILPEDSIVYENGAINNDANHISGPSRTAEGLFCAISRILKNTNKEDISFINAHGTATLFNDDMESIAIDRCELNAVPVNSLKGYFGHVLGAAGIIETIISAYALQNNIILKSYGFDNLGVVKPITVNNTIIQSNKNRFMKLVAGFGGSNAAIIFKKLKK